MLPLIFDTDQHITEPHMLYNACKAKVDHAREFASKLDGKKSG